MDKIKTVKIKNSDGSVSEESYTISVDAINVDMENGKDLQDTIGTINVDTDGNIAEQLKKYKSYDADIEEIDNNINILQNTLQEKIYYFDTVDDMKAATYLKNGDCVHTLGYYSVNDGGAAEYKIVSTTSQTDYQEELQNGLYATLILENYVTPEQFGAKGDGVTDDYNALNNAVKYSNCVILNDKTYSISDFLALKNNFTLKGTSKKSKLYNTGSHPCIRDLNINNVLIENLTIEDSTTGTSSNNNGIYVSGDNIRINDVIVNSVGGDGILFGTSTNVSVTNSKIINSGLIALLAFEGDNVLFKNLYIKGAGHKYTCQFKSCINSTMEDIIIEEGSEISCLSSIQSITENPNPVLSRNITIKNIKIINHGKNWTPEDNNLVACLCEGFNYYISDIEIINSYTGGIKLEITDSIAENININGYGLNNQNHIGAYFTDATDYGDNNIIKNIVVKNGVYQGVRSHLSNSHISNIHIIDCGTSSNPQYVSADSNSIIDDVILTAKNIDCRGLGFAYSTYVASNSRYTNIKRIKADGYTSYDISGGSLPDSIYIKCEDSVKFNAGRGNITCPFEYNRGIVTMYNRNASTSGITPTQGDIIYFNETAKASTGYFGVYYNGTDWINIIPITTS